MTHEPRAAEVHYLRSLCSFGAVCVCGYLCLQAECWTLIWELVTCANCLKQKPEEDKK